MSLYRIDKIDFSNGIKSEVVNNNFEILQQQIDNERITSAGYGIAEGLDFIVEDGTSSTYWKDFNILFTKGTIINKDGSNAIINAKKIEIEKPELIEQNEKLIVDKDGYVTLLKTPYSINRTTTADNVSLQYSGIEANYEGSKIDVSSVLKNKVLIDNVEKNKGLMIDVKYFTSAKRLDYVYVNTNNEIELLKGTTSFSPTIRTPEHEDINFPVCILLIDPFKKEYISNIEKTNAAISVMNDERNKRAIYVDNNELYIYGEKYINMQSIKLQKPEEPEDFTFWYNAFNNKLMVFRETSEGIKEWTSVNDESLVTVYESYIWGNDHKIWETNNYVTFTFDRDDIEQWPRLCFIPGKNSIEVFVDNMPLHSNQFEEIVELSQEPSKDEKEEIGIGFKILQTLPRRANVEIRVKHRVKVSFLQTRFQRSATFSASNYLTISNINDRFLILQDSYRYKENQIDIFLNGARLTKGLNFYEDRKSGSTLSRGNMCNTIELDSNLVIKSGDIISYKIITTIFSYDHIDDYFENMDSKFNILKDNVEKDISDMNITLNNYINSNDDTVQRLVDSVDDNRINIARCLKDDVKLTESNLSDGIVNGISKGLINAKFTVGAANIINPSDISPSITLDSKDFVILFNLSKQSVLAYGTDYIIERNGSSFLIRILNTSNVVQGNIIYITGINF